MARKTKYNNITTPELIKNFNSENQRLIDDFVMYLKSIQRSETTIKGYCSDLDIFFVWNLQNNRNKFFINLTKRDIISFQNWLLSNNENSPARIRRIKSTLSSLSNYIENILDDEYPNFKNIIRKVENPVNQPVREKTVFSDEQLEKLLNILKDKGDYQKMCCVACAMMSGSRKSEIPRFKVDYFKDENIIFGSLYKTPEKIKTKGRALGKYIHRYVLAKEFKSYLDLWLKERKELNIDSEWLFVSKDKETGKWKQLETDTMNSWAMTFTNMLGIDFYWHSLRHYFTTHLSRLGLPDNIIQEIVGWDSADMVKIYKDISTDEQLSQYFSEDGIKTDKKGLFEL